MNLVAGAARCGLRRYQVVIVRASSTIRGTAALARSSRPSPTAGMPTGQQQRDGRMEEGSKESNIGNRRPKPVPNNMHVEAPSIVLSAASFQLQMPAAVCSLPVSSRCARTRRGGTDRGRVEATEAPQFDEGVNPPPKTQRLTSDDEPSCRFEGGASEPSRPDMWGLEQRVGQPHSSRSDSLVTLVPPMNQLPRHPAVQCFIDCYAWRGTGRRCRQTQTRT